MTVAWHRMNYMMGCTTQWDSAQILRDSFRILQQPAGRHFLIGDQMSYHPGWQEGAISSAHLAMAEMDRRVREAAQNA